MNKERFKSMNCGGPLAGTKSIGVRDETEEDGEGEDGEGDKAARQHVTLIQVIIRNKKYWQ